MNENLRYIFNVIAAIVTNGDVPAEPENTDWEMIYAVCMNLKIANIFAYITSSDKISIPEKIKQEFLKSIYYNISVDELQRNEIDIIFNAFEENSLDYMPLKGILLKQMYPSPDMRRMGDADILIRKELYDKYDSVMKELGYTYVKEGGAEYVYSKGKVVIELHKYSINPENEDMYSYYGTGWKLANKESDSCFRYYLNKEDEFVYLITHFAKHYRNAGCGVKPLIDIWLYKKKNNIDMKYVDKQLKILNLYEFAYHIFRLISVLFENKIPNDTDKEMIKFIFASGEYGNTANIAAAESIRGEYEKKSGVAVRLNSYRKIIFISRKGMIELYPVLNKMPFLLPVLWVHRLINALLRKRDKISGHVKAVENRFGENVSRYDCHMNMVGLDIFNGRKKD